MAEIAAVTALSGSGTDVAPSRGARIADLLCRAVGDPGELPASLEAIRTLLGARAVAILVSDVMGRVLMLHRQGAAGASGEARRVDATAVGLTLSLWVWPDGPVDAAASAPAAEDRLRGLDPFLRRVAILAANRPPAAAFEGAEPAIFDAVSGPLAQVTPDGGVVALNPAAAASGQARGDLASAGGARMSGRACAGSRGRWGRPRPG